MTTIQPTHILLPTYRHYEDHYCVRRSTNGHRNQDFRDRFELYHIVYRHTFDCAKKSYIRRTQESAYTLMLYFNLNTC